MTQPATLEMLIEEMWVKAIVDINGYEDVSADEIQCLIEKCKRLMRAHSWSEAYIRFYLRMLAIKLGDLAWGNPTTRLVVSLISLETEKVA